jgi:hypothetical protein
LLNIIIIKHILEFPIYKNASYQEKKKIIAYLFNELENNPSYGDEPRTLEMLNNMSKLIIKLKREVKKDDKEEQESLLQLKSKVAQKSQVIYIKTLNNTPILKRRDR